MSILALGPGFPGPFFLREPSFGTRFAIGVKISSAQKDASYRGKTAQITATLRLVRTFCPLFWLDLHGNLNWHGF